MDREEDDYDSEVGGHEVKASHPGDEQAAWTRKGKRIRCDYKVRAAVHAEHGFILAGHATQPKRSDGKEMMAVVRQCGLEEGSPVFADKGCGSQANRCDLEEAGLLDGVNSIRRPEIGRSQRRCS